MGIRVATSMRPFYHVHRWGEVKKRNPTTLSPGEVDSGRLILREPYFVSGWEVSRAEYLRVELYRITSGGYWGRGTARGVGVGSAEGGVVVGFRASVTFSISSIQA